MTQEKLNPFNYDGPQITLVKITEENFTLSLFRCYVNTHASYDVVVLRQEYSHIIHTKISIISTRGNTKRQYCTTPDFRLREKYECLIVAAYKIIILLLQGKRSGNGH